MRALLLSVLVLAGCEGRRSAALEVSREALRLDGEVLALAKDVVRHDYLNIPELEDVLRDGAGTCGAIDTSAEVPVALAKRVAFTCGAAGKGPAVLLTPGAEVRLVPWRRDVAQALVVSRVLVTAQDQRRELSRTRLDEAEDVAAWARLVVHATKAALTPGVVQVVVGDEVTLGEAVLLREALEREGFRVSLVVAA